MMSLFSPFDLGNFSISGFLFFLFFMFFISSFYYFGSNSYILECTNYFFMVNLSSSNKNFSKLFILIFVTLFFLFLFLNSLSVFSYIFPLTSQPSILLFYSLTFWGSYLIFSLAYNFKGFLSHLIPAGAPLGLCLFLILIEFVSFSIRPFTLMVRMVSNIMAGHLMMILIFKLPLVTLMPGLFYMVFNLVELGVSLIQAYIFVTLLSLYYNDLV